MLILSWRSHAQIHGSLNRWLLSAVFIFIRTLVCVILSYLYTIRTILRFPSAQQRTKGFSTCSSHNCSFYHLWQLYLCLYQPSAKDEMAINKGEFMLTTPISPMLNPFIYTLRNKQVKQAFNDLEDLHCSQRNRGMFKSGSWSMFSSLFILFCLDLDLGFHSVLSLIKSPFAPPYKPASLRMINFIKKKMRIVVLGNLRVTSQPFLTNAERIGKFIIKYWCNSAHHSSRKKPTQEEK